jgi:hypothetical protein
MVGHDLEFDAEGSLVLRPIMGCTTAPLAETSVFLRIQYAETAEELNTGGRSIQFVLTAQAALELAEMLTKQARHLLAPSPKRPMN